MREVPPGAVALIQRFEGFSYKPYLCAAGVWTIGYGHALTIDGKQLRGMEQREAAEALYPHGISTEAAEDLLRLDIARAAESVLRLAKVKLTDGQYGALVSFVYNLGAGQLRISTLLRKLNAGDSAGAADEFAKWHFANRKPLEGLMRRRKAERDLFLS